MADSHLHAMDLDNFMKTYRKPSATKMTALILEANPSRSAILEETKSGTTAKMEITTQNTSQMSMLFHSLLRAKY